MDWLGHSRLTSKDLSKGFRVCEGADFKVRLAWRWFWSLNCLQVVVVVVVVVVFAVNCSACFKSPENLCFWPSYMLDFWMALQRECGKSMSFWWNRRNAHLRINPPLGDKKARLRATYTRTNSRHHESLRALGNHPKHSIVGNYRNSIFANVGPRVY